MKKLTKAHDKMNDKIRVAMRKVHEAEMDGLRGEAMIAAKRELRLLQEEYKRIPFGK